MRKFIYIFTALFYLISCKKDEEGKCDGYGVLEEFSFDVIGGDTYDDIKGENGKLDTNKMYLFRYENGKKAKIPFTSFFYKTGKLHNPREVVELLTISVEDREELKKLYSLKKEMFYLQDLCGVSIIEVQAIQKDDCTRVVPLHNRWYDGKRELDSMTRGWRYGIYRKNR